MCPRIRCLSGLCFFFFFFNDTATTEIYTLSLHDALPISALAPEPPLAVIPFDPYGGAIYVPGVINGDSAWLMLDTGLSRTGLDRKSTRLNSSHGYISYAVFCLKKKKTNIS